MCLRCWWVCTTIIFTNCKHIWRIIVWVKLILYTVPPRPLRIFMAISITDKLSHCFSVYTRFIFNVESVISLTKLIRTAVIDIECHLYEVNKCTGQFKLRKNIFHSIYRVVVSSLGSREICERRYFRIQYVVSCQDRNVTMINDFFYQLTNLICKMNFVFRIP